MMSRNRQRLVTVLAVGWLGSAMGLAQDLDELRERADAFWAARVDGSQLQALDYVTPEDREQFLRAQPGRILAADVIGLAFPNQADAVDVQTRMRIQIPSMGEVELTAVARWTWTNRDWFYDLPEAGESLFTDSSGSGIPGPGAPEAESVEFEFLVPSVELGLVTQGETVEGLLEFQGDGTRVRGVSTDRDELPKGLRFGPPEWMDEESGRLPYTWDTTLVSADEEAVIEFRVRSRTDVVTTRPVDFRGRVDGLIQFSQVPEVADMSESGELEIRLENLAAPPFRIVSANALNRDYDVEWSDAEEPLAPGGVHRILVRYPAQDRPRRASVNLSFEEEVLGRRTVNVPLSVVAPEPPAARRPTREDLDRLLRQPGSQPSPQ